MARILQIKWQNTSIYSGNPVLWGDIGPLEVVEMFADYPDKQSTDVAWVYISIGGDVYSEAIAVIVIQESSEYKIREVEFGRP